MSASGAAISLRAPATVMGRSASTVTSTSFPRRPSLAPRITSISPWPPESTTPASFNTGSISGVRERTLSPSAITWLTNSMMSLVLGASSTARSAIPLATVRIVPSFGFITAL